MNLELNQLLATISEHKRVYIQPHDIPDPDAIASSFGLKYFLEALGIKAEIIYAELIEKANSRTMLELFDIDMYLKEKSYELHKDDLIILVDTQIGHSNLTDFNSHNIGVIDHHRYMGDKNYAFMDIKPEYGACATIIASYFNQMAIEPEKRVATALLYAIMTDTDNLVRSTDIMDLEMFYWLYKKADLDQIRHLRMNEIGLQDLEAYTRALQNIEIYGSTCFVDIGDCNDSLLGTISDMVFTIENVDTIVSYAKRDDGIKLSIRCGDKSIKAFDLVEFIIDNRGAGGGHDEMAGGFISLEEVGLLQNKNFDTYVRYRTLKYIEWVKEGK
jgi:nanoRNase/pAp phosphatase (c-di-AMP/oligoRNAs hydrolase)